MRKSILTVLSVLTLCLFINAAPHSGDLFNLQQPDGSRVPVHVWGDEYYQRVESPDGYTLIRNDEGWITYAEVNDSNSDFVSTGVVYKGTQRSSAPRGLAKGLTLNADARSKKAQESPLWGAKNRDGSRAFDLDKKDVTGTRKGLTILIDFSDQPAAISYDKMNNFVNGENFTGDGCNGSVYEYYKDISGGALEYTNQVTHYYRAKNPKSYYDDNQQSGPKAKELIEEALRSLHESGKVDVSELSVLDDGTVMALNILYAGEPDNGWSKGLWPHMWNFQNGLRVGGKLFYRYQITNIGRQLKLTTFCHENGHMVGQWPDLYDYGQKGGSTRGGGIGHYGLMCNMGDPKNPVPPNAFFRSVASWDTLVDITDKNGTVNLVSNSNTSYVYRNPSNSREMFVVESRLNTGRNASLPGEGLIVWHVDKDGHNDYEHMTPSQHYLVSLEQADGRYDLEKNRNSGDGSDPFTSSNGSSFNDNTSPDANWWNGSASGIDIRDISAAGETMSFQIGEEVAEYTITAEAGAGGSISPSGTVSVAEGESLEFTITPDDGYETAYLMVDGDSLAGAPEYAFTDVRADHSIQVEFEPASEITVKSPNGGEVYDLGAEMTISWSNTTGENADISLEWADGAQMLISGTAKESLTWTVPEDMPEGEYFIKAVAGDSEDLSDEPFTIKDIVISDDLTSFADWYVIADEFTGENKSTAVLDTTNISDGIIGADMSVGVSNVSDEIYPYAGLVGEVTKSLAGMTAVVVRYKASVDFTISLDQDGLSETGESYVAPLEQSDTWNEVMIPLESFSQPEWVSSSTELDLSLCKSMTFAGVDAYGSDISIQIENLQLHGWEHDPSGVVTESGTNASAALTAAALPNGRLRLGVPAAGTYQLRIFTPAGRLIENRKLSLNSGENTLELNAGGAVQGVRFLSIDGKKQNSVHTLVW
ncbi:MAG: M6 family metalloprotease domain-containing protein [Fibrobacterota bacterium]